MGSRSLANRSYHLRDRGGKSRLFASVSFPTGNRIRISLCFNGKELVDWKKLEPTDRLEFVDRTLERLKIFAI